MKITEKPIIEFIKNEFPFIAENTFTIHRYDLTNPKSIELVISYNKGKQYIFVTEEEILKYI